MELDQLFGDGESQPKPAVDSRGSAVLLAEALEKMGKETGADSLAIVDELDLHVGCAILHDDLHQAAAGGEFDGIGQEVPEDLLETGGIGKDKGGAAVDGSGDGDVA